MNDNPSSLLSLSLSLAVAHTFSARIRVLELACTFASERASDRFDARYSSPPGRPPTVAVCQVVKEVPRDFKGAVKPRIYSRPFLLLLLLRASLSSLASFPGATKFGKKRGRGHSLPSLYIYISSLLIVPPRIPLSIFLVAISVERGGDQVLSMDIGALSVPRTD